ncbi:MAG: hypothetical protein OEY28_14405, partial [Nitrospira sp.]|nr:hypothetical protein [Nitrospira sp.]
DLPTGEYWLVVTLDGERSEYGRAGLVIHAETVNIAGTLVRRDLVLSPPNPSDYVKVFVSGPKGQQVTDVEFWSAVSLGEDYLLDSSRKAQAFEWGDGSFLVPKPTLMDRPWMTGPNEGTRFLIGVSSTHYGVKEVEYEDRPRAEVRVQFSEPSWLEVRVLGWATHRYRHMIELHPRSDRSPIALVRRPKYPVIGETWTFGPLQHYDVQFDLVVKNGELGSIVIGSQTFALTPGVNTGEITIPALYSLTIVKDGADSGVLAVLFDHALDNLGFSCKSWFNDNGEATFAPLPALEYQVGIAGPGDDGVMLVRLDTDLRINFQKTVFNAYKVVRVYEDGLFAQYGGQTGDLIVGLNGADFENREHMQEMWGKYCTKVNTLELKVDRAGAVFSIEVHVAEGHSVGLGVEVLESVR